MPLRQVAVALDQLANTLLGGWADESISARAYRLGALRGSKGWMKVQDVLDTLFFWDPSHCESAYQAEQQRRQLPVEYRK